MTTLVTESPDIVKESALTTREVADALGRPTQYVYQLIITGRLVGARKESGRWLVPPRVVRAYIKETQGPTP